MRKPRSNHKRAFKAQTRRQARASAGAFNVPASSSTSAYKTTGTGARSVRFSPGTIGPNAALARSLDKLRAQSRDQARKSPIVTAATDRIVANIVGSGIKPQLTKQQMEAFLAWTDHSSVDGMNDFYGQQAQIARAVVDGGECFSRSRMRTATAIGIVPLQVEVLEAEFVPIEKNEVLTNGNTVRHGIEFDAEFPTKRVAYYVWKFHPADGVFGTTGNELIRVPAEEIDHIYFQERPGQIRGEPWFAQVLDKVADLDIYMTAELLRKQTEAMFTGFLRKPTPEGGFSAEELREIYGDGDDEGNVELSPGTMQVLLPGEDVEFSSPANNSTALESFRRMMLREIAAAVGLPYETFSNDWSQINDRTYRASMNEFRRLCAMWQHQILVFQFCRPVFRRWATAAMLQGMVIDPLKAVVWTPERWAYINPVQDIKAMQDEVLAGFTSRSAIVSARGEDAEEVDAQQAADNTRADGLGLTYASDARVDAEALPASEDDSEDDLPEDTPLKAGRVG